MALDTGRKKGYNDRSGTNRVNDLIEASRVFSIGQQQYIFDELENIFFLDKPINQREYKNTPKCNTCQTPWKKQSEL